MKRLGLKIFGKVQNVIFRFGVQKIASELGLVGWVKNNLDGSVDLIAEGDIENLKKIQNWCKVGPKLAKVDKVEQKWESIESLSFDSFKII